MLDSKLNEGVLDEVVRWEGFDLPDFDLSESQCSEE